MATETQFPTAVLVTGRWAAAYLGLSHDTFQRMVKAGTLEQVRIPGLGRPKYRRADIEALIRGEERTQ